MGKLSDRYGRKRLALLTLPVGPLLCCSLSQAREPLAIVAGLLVFGAF